MSQEEMDREVLECARYGEEDDLRSLLVAGASVNHTDGSGNTAIHKASANGEVGCLRVLKEFGAIYLGNKQGNLPTHWAAQNGKVETLQFLIDNYADQIDMLAKNSFGRSSLTDAFQSQNEAVIEICLSHPSASEERLMPNQGGEADPQSQSLESAVEGMDIAADALDAESALERHAVQHCMALSALEPGAIVRIRELPITRADSPFGTDTAPEDDTTGLGIWPAAVLAARWVAEDLLEATRGKVVVELGCGCGLPGLTAARYGSPRTVYLTDIHTPTLKNTMYNARLNSSDAGAASPAHLEGKAAAASAGGSVFLAASLDESRWGVLDQTIVISSSSAPVDVYTSRVSWTDPSTYPADKADVLLGSDLVYDTGILRALTQAVSGMLAPGGSFFYVAPEDGRLGMDGLKEALLACGLGCVEEGPCGDGWFRNPLMELDEERGMVPAHDAYVLHFYDLAAKTRHLWYHFRRV